MQIIAIFLVLTLGTLIAHFNPNICIAIILIGGVAIVFLPNEYPESKEGRK